jgi:hypothetical protein
MKPLAALLLLILAAACSARASRYHLTGHGVTKAEMGKMRARIDKGVGAVESFFGGSYGKAFAVEVYGDRAGLDGFFKSRWHAPPTEKWMVAAGVAEVLVILAPSAWKAEAAEHNGDDENEVQKIVTHELVHVFHAQQNPRPEFDGMDDFAWFIEGLATFASGQLDGRQLTGKQAIEAGKEPKSLAEAWTGRYRYGVSGSIVRYVDAKYGRSMLVKLLKVTGTSEALKMLGTDEASLLKAWRLYELGSQDGVSALDLGSLRIPKDFPVDVGTHAQ